MEYSELAAAFADNDTSKINELFAELHPRLVRFLQIHLDAALEDAEDCAQNALLISLETIEKGEMRDAEHLLSFLLSTCRNNYLNLQIKKRPQLTEDDLDLTRQPPRQLNQLLDKERQTLLAQCMEKLSADYRTFIQYWFDDPGTKAKQAAAHFGMSVSNVWTKKHRIIKKLSKCYQNKIKK